VNTPLFGRLSQPNVLFIARMRSVLAPDFSADTRSGKKLSHAAGSIMSKREISPCFEMKPGKLTEGISASRTA